MASRSIRINATGFADAQEKLLRLNPDKNPAIWINSLTRMAVETQRQSKLHFRRGQTTKGKAHPTRITSRTGQLRGSIEIDYSGIPQRIAIGSEIPYAAVHEYGGRVHRRGHTRRLKQSKKRVRASVRSGKRYKRAAHVKPHIAVYKARPYLAPGLEKAERKFGDIMVAVLREQFA